jgi:hypothetical protein
MKKYIFSVTLILMSMSVFAQKNNPPGLELIKESDLKKDLYAFADPHFKGRSAGTLDELKASMWLAEKYREIGLLPSLNCQTLTMADLDKARDYCLVPEGGLRLAHRDDRHALNGMQWRSCLISRIIIPV